MIVRSIALLAMVDHAPTFVRPKLVRVLRFPPERRLSRNGWLISCVRIMWIAREPE